VQKIIEIGQCFMELLKKNSGKFFMDQGTLKVILFFNSSLASSKTKNI